MRLLRTVSILLIALPAAAQSTTVPAQNPNVAADVYRALTGHWSGVLEYRDFTTNADTTLPTRLDCEPAADGKSLTMRDTFQDGPRKVIRSTTHVTIDPARHTWTTTSDEDPTQIYQLEGLPTLQAGLGKLKLRNHTTENKLPVDAITTVTLGKDLLVMEQKTRPVGGEFKFRHAYNFTRTATAAPEEDAAPARPDRKPAKKYDLPQLPGLTLPGADLPAAPEPATVPAR